MYMYLTEKLPFGSLVYIQNNLSFRILSRQSIDRHVSRTRPQPCSISLLRSPEPQSFQNQKLPFLQRFKFHEMKDPIGT